VGALAGATVGYGLGQVLSGRRVLAVLAALLAVGVTALFRVYLGRILPRLGLWQHGKIPLYLWISVGLSTILGGLAGHDLCEYFNVSSGLVIGSVSGVQAALSMALLMVLYFHEHPEVHLEF
jgi:hypothetical protein